MAELRRQARLYWTLQKAAVRSVVQYRGNLAFMVAAGMAYNGSGFAFLWVLLNTVPSLAGWSLSELAFLYGLRLVVHALRLILMSGVGNVSHLVRTGEFERVLLRPANPLVLVAPNTRSLLPLGDLSVALLVFTVAVIGADIDWSVWAVLLLVLGVIGGTLVEAAAVLAASSLSIRYVNAWTVLAFVDDSIGITSAYPVTIYGVAVRRVLTYVLPVAFIAYLPASVLLDRTGELSVPAFLAYLGPVVGTALFYLAYRLWMGQLRHYGGVGH